MVASPHSLAATVNPDKKIVILRTTCVKLFLWLPLPHQRSTNAPIEPVCCLPLRRISQLSHMQIIELTRLSPVTIGRAWADLLAEPAADADSGASPTTGCYTPMRTHKQLATLRSTALCGALLLLPPVMVSANDDPVDTGKYGNGESGQTAWSERAVAEHIDQSAYRGTLGIEELQKLVAAGEKLFSARFTVLDGVGRPMATQAIIPTKRKRLPRSDFQRIAGLDANSCQSCHNQPVTGGAGDFSVNVFVSEGFQNIDFDSTDAQFSNERNTNHLFGSGLVELLAREMTYDLTALRSAALKQARRSGLQQTVELVSKGVNFGSITAFEDGTVDTASVHGIDPDLIIRPFGQKGVMTSLRQFTINALNHHHGMQAEERFGRRWTGESDFDEDGISNEITVGDVSALVAWQATLPAPVPEVPTDPEWREAAAAGRQQFKSLGCQECHKPALPLNSLVFHDPGPFDTAGTRRQLEDSDGIRYDLAALPRFRALQRDAEGRVLVPLFGDLKRHIVADQDISHFGNELLAQRFVERNVFITAELWGVGATGPYGHRGDLTTLEAVILAHGGEARESRDRFEYLETRERQQIIAFLRTLVLPETPVAATQ